MGLHEEPRVAASKQRPGLEVLALLLSRADEAIK
jgi:hypothetical protein